MRLVLTMFPLIQGCALCSIIWYIDFDMYMLCFDFVTLLGVYHFYEFIILLITINYRKEKFEIDAYHTL